MIYKADLDSGQSIEIENLGRHTRITISSHSAGAGQTQSSSTASSFETGAWISPPVLTLDPDGYTVRLATEAGQRGISISGGGMRLLEGAPEAGGVGVTLSESQEAASPMKPMAPMKPLKPMRMGNMEMRAGEMRMGNMRMSLGESRQAPQSPPQSEPRIAPQVLADQDTAQQSRFCTQCGARAEAGDRFCGACGNRLRAAS